MLLESGPGVWEPMVEAPLYRKVAEGRVEDGLLGIGTIRKILQDIDSSTMDTFDVASLSIVWSYVGRLGKVGDRGRDDRGGEGGS